MSILKLILTAAAFCAASAGATDSSCSQVRVSGGVLLQRDAKLQERLGSPSSAKLLGEEIRQVATTTAAESAGHQAWRWWSWVDVFGEELAPILGNASAPTTTMGKTIHRHHISSWTRVDKVILISVSAAMVLLDACVLQRFVLSGLRQHLCVVALWVGVGLAFNVLVYVRHGSNAGVEWCSGYLLEWLLSMDNLFIFHLIFRLYKTPKQVVHKALFLGIVGAVVCRLMFFAIVRELLDFVGWFRFIFGAFLIWSGIQAAGEEEEAEVSENRIVRFLRWMLGSRLQETYGKEAGSLLVWNNGQVSFTLLLPVICCLEITDVIFALDSVSAKAAQIPDYWVSVSSSIFAMFALRAMFFVVQDLVALFELMKYGLCCILVFIGIELMVSDFFVLPPQVVCSVIVSVFAVSIMGSAALNRSPPAEGVLQSAKTIEPGAKADAPTQATKMSSEA